MTITIERPVTWPTMTEAPNIMDRARVGELIGVEADTVKAYQKPSRYPSRPFPKPDGYFGREPYWFVSRSDEIRAWNEGRERPGIGGGRRSPA